MKNTFHYSLFLVLYIILVTLQLNISIAYIYNHALIEHVYAIKVTEAERVDFNIRDILTYDDFLFWMKHNFINIPQQDLAYQSGYQGYFMLEYNIVIGSRFRMCFELTAPFDDDNAFTPRYDKLNNKKDNSLESYQKSKFYNFIFTFRQHLLQIWRPKWNW